MRKFKTKLLLSSIAITAIAASTQASNLKPLVPARQSAISDRATTNAASFPPLLSSSTFTTGREQHVDCR